MKKLTHVNSKGNINMVDITDKKITGRECRAYGEIFLSENAFRHVIENKLKKGDVLTTAKIAGIQAAKKTWELIPLCHNIPINKIDIEIELSENNNSIHIYSFVKTTASTGIEMEAITAVSVAAITIYDMCKSIDHDIIISNIQLLEKTGGKSGEIKRSIVTK